MTDTTVFGGGLNSINGPAQGPTSVNGAPLQGTADQFASMQAPPPVTPPAPAPQAAPPPAQSQGSGFGGGLSAAFGGPSYHAPDPATSALDQTADLLQQRITRANEVAANPVRQFFDPEEAARARAFVPQATEQLQKIKAQKADMAANRQQAETLGLHPGDVTDEASQADRMEVARARALKGDLTVFKGLQAVDPKAAEAIQDQVHEVVAGHLTNAQLAYDSLAGVQNQGQYAAKLRQLRQDGTLTDIEALGLKIPPTFDGFNAVKATEGQALREARIGIDKTRQQLEDRNTYLPMEEKEAKTYSGRIKTVYGDDIPGTWSRNGASNTRGLVVPGMADPRTVGPLATPEQRKGLKDDFALTVPKEDMEKYRAFNRTYDLATKDSKGKQMPDGKLNTNPNVQQGVAEGLASMLRGGSGGANVGLLKIELAKRGWAQGAIDGLVSNYAGAVNTMFADANKPYLTANTQKQIRDVMDVLKTYNDTSISDRVGDLAKRAGALRLDSSVFGFTKGESAGAVDTAIKEGRDAQIAQDMTRHQSIGGGDGVLQLGAQRAGAGATALPPGTAPVNQQPGGDRIATPVQQAAQPPGQPSPPVGPNGPQPVNPAPPAGPAQPGTPPPPASPPGSGGGQPPAPVTVAGQSITPNVPPGVSPSFVPNMQRIESGNEKDPWTSTTKGSSASGAFQMIDKTWNANKPAGAPARAKDATPAQQVAANDKLMATNAAALKGAGVPVTDTNMYVAHNLGPGGAASLLHASPNADARTVVGEDAAKNNPLFFKGRPTVATVLARYDDEMNKGGAGGGGIADVARHSANAHRGAAAPAAEAPGLMTRISRMLSQGIPGSGADKDAAVGDVGRAAVDNAPAILSTAGAVGGSALGPAGTVAGGAAGGGAGQALKDYLQGNAQSPAAIARQTALGGVLGVGGASRPVLGAVARAVGAGGVEAGADALEHGASADTVDAGLKGVAYAAGGETFGRALGMIGHKVWNMFAPEAKTAVRDAAKSFHEATETLATETPKLPGVGGAAGGDNPKYTAAEAAKEKAETVLKDAGLKPEEAAYAHRVSSEGVPKQEAEAARPGALEKDRVGAGYQQLQDEVGAAGVGAPKASPKLPDGPRAAVESKQVSAKHAELADHVEMAITAPAANWSEKWTQLKDARSQLLQAERDALSSTAPGKTKTAADMRTLADTVRAQQAKAAKYVFGEKDGEAFMGRLKMLDTRYRNLMEATNGGDLARASRLSGEAGRDAEKKFVAFAHDDPQAIAAYRAMRGVKGDLAEATVPWTVAAEGLPVVGKVVKVAKLAGILKEWARERTAGSPAKFSDFVKTNAGAAEVGQTVRDLTGTAAQRGATMQ